MILAIATHFSVAWSVFRLLHFRTLLKTFHGFKCHLAGKLVGSNVVLCHVGVSDLREREILGVKSLTETCICF